MRRERGGSSHRCRGATARHRLREPAWIRTRRASPASTCGHDGLRRRDDRTRLPRRRAGRDGHRHRDDHGSRHRQVRRHRERRVHRRRHRGNRRRHRHRRDDRPVRRRDDPDDRRLREPGEPSGSAWHPGSGGEAWSRDWDGVRRGEVHPDLRGDDLLHPERVRRRPDEVHPGPEPDAGRRVADRPVPERDAARGARRVRTSRDCCRRAVPSVPAWGREQWALWAPTLPVPRGRVPPEQPVPRERQVLRVSEPGQRVPGRREPTGPEPARRAPRVLLRPVPRGPPEPASDRGGGRPASGLRRFRTDGRRSTVPRRRTRTGTTHGDVARPVLPRSTTPTSRTRPALSAERVDPCW